MLLWIYDSLFFRQRFVRSCGTRSTSLTFTCFQRPSSFIVTDPFPLTGVDACWSAKFTLLVWCDNSGKFSIFVCHMHHPSTIYLYSAIFPFRAVKRLSSSAAFASFVFFLGLSHSTTLCPISPHRWHLYLKAVLQSLVMRFESLTPFF